jgi:hypothetical protein
MAAAAVVPATTAARMARERRCLCLVWGNTSWGPLREHHRTRFHDLGRPAVPTGMTGHGLPMYLPLHPSASPAVTLRPSLRLSGGATRPPNITNIFLSPA